MKTKLILFLFAALATFASANENLNPSPTNPPASVKEPTLYDKVLAAARKNPPAPGDVICLGSSHMQRWETVSADLAPLTVHNYGIGGSQMSDAANRFIDSLAIPFQPRAVILYEGSNDIADGHTPETVLTNFQKFERKLHAALPATRLYVISLVPSPGQRFEKINDLRKTNEFLRQECATQNWMKFLDITTPLIGADGRPKANCFIPGDIHMLPPGYAIWKSVIAPVVVPSEKSYEKSK